MRMSELKGYATQDPLKSESDVASYNNEFKDLQVQLYQISQMDFNGAVFLPHTGQIMKPQETDSSNFAVFEDQIKMPSGTIHLIFIQFSRIWRHKSKYS